MTHNDWDGHSLEEEYKAGIDNVSKIILTTEHDFGSIDREYTGKEMRNFISTLLAQTRQETIKEIAYKIVEMDRTLTAEAAVAEISSATMHDVCVKTQEIIIRRIFRKLYKEYDITDVHQSAPRKDLAEYDWTKDPISEL